MSKIKQLRAALSLHTLPKLGFSAHHRSFRATFLIFCSVLLIESITMQLLAQPDSKPVTLSATPESPSEAGAVGSIAAVTPTPEPTPSQVAKKILASVAPSQVQAATTSQPQTAVMGWRSPLRSYTLTQYFSSRHTAIDMAAPSGTPIYASAPGTVSGTGYLIQGGGLMVKVTHSSGHVTYYAHMSSITSKVGQLVDNETQIGRVGSTGWATGPHLHFMVMNASGNAINPLSVLK